MEFSSMIIKNIKHNIKNYTAYLLGNSIIQCILFMFFTLVFSPKFMEAEETSVLKGNFISILVLMIAFSAAFIIYTTVSFTKYRGREFGVYFTIGLTSKEIIKILCYENIIISLSSFMFSALAGSVLSRLFHMAIGKILKIDNISIPLSFKAFGAVFLISVAIFLFTTIYQTIFLKKHSIISILKSRSKKDIGSTAAILGAIGIVIFICSLLTFNRVVNGKIKESQNLFMVASIIGTAVSVYLLIGFSMTIVVKVMRNFKGIYNNNILFINSLSHRFLSYRTVLYVVTLMVSGAMIFISISYSVYKSTARQLDIKYPYDVSFIVDKTEMKEREAKAVDFKKLEEVKSYVMLEGLNVPYIRVSEGKCLWLGPEILVISEESYKNIGKGQLNLKKGEILYCHSEKRGSFSEGGFMLDLTKKVMNENMPLEEYKKQHKRDEYIYIEKDNKREKMDIISNNNISDDYLRVEALVVNNEDYKMMKEKLGDKAITYDILINLKSRNSYKGVRDKVNTDFSKKANNTLTIKSKIFDDTIRENGFMLFIFSFMGMMFLVGSAAVLYFKTITSIEEDRDRSKQLMKIGLTKKEINKLSMKELGAVFLVAPIIALVCTGYFLSTIYKIINDGEYMWQNSLFVFAIYLVIQIIFYFLTSNKYKKQITV